MTPPAATGTAMLGREWFAGPEGVEILASRSR
jgi:hypothetical protein